MNQPGAAPTGKAPVLKVQFPPAMLQSPEQTPIYFLILIFFFGHAVSRAHLASLRDKTELRFASGPMRTWNRWALSLLDLSQICLLWARVVPLVKPSAPGIRLCAEVRG